MRAYKYFARPQIWPAATREREREKAAPSVRPSRQFVRLSACSPACLPTCPRPKGSVRRAAIRPNGGAPVAVLHCRH